LRKDVSGQHRAQCSPPLLSPAGSRQERQRQSGEELPSSHATAPGWPCGSRLEWYLSRPTLPAPPRPSGCPAMTHGQEEDSCSGLRSNPQRASADGSLALERKLTGDRPASAVLGSKLGSSHLPFPNRRFVHRNVATAAIPVTTPMRAPVITSGGPAAGAAAGGAFANSVQSCHAKPILPSTDAVIGIHHEANTPATKLVKGTAAPALARSDATMTAAIMKPRRISPIPRSKRGRFSSMQSRTDMMLLRASTHAKCVSK
jgi:hypothetical protein